MLWKIRTLVLFMIENGDGIYILLNIYNRDRMSLVWKTALRIKAVNMELPFSVCCSEQLMFISLKFPDRLVDDQET